MPRRHKRPAEWDVGATLCVARQYNHPPSVGASRWLARVVGLARSQTIRRIVQAAPRQAGGWMGCRGDTVCRPPTASPDIGRCEPVARPPGRPSAISGVSADRVGRECRADTSGRLGAGVGASLGSPANSQLQQRARVWQMIHRIAPTIDGCLCGGRATGSPLPMQGESASGVSANRPYRCREMARRGIVRRASHRLAPTDAGRWRGGRFTQSPLPMPGDGAAGDSHNRPYRCREMARRAIHTIAPTDAGRWRGGRFTQSPLPMPGDGAAGDSHNRPYRCREMARRAIHTIAPTDAGRWRGGRFTQSPLPMPGDGAAGDSHNRPYRCREMARRAIHTIAPTGAG